MNIRKMRPGWIAASAPMRRFAAFVFVLGSFGLLAVPSATAGAASDPPGHDIVENSVSDRGAAVQQHGLAHQAGVCGSLRPIHLPDEAVACTHGTDPAPDGINPTRPQPLVVPGQAQGLIFPDSPGGAPTTAAGTAGIPCYGEGSSGNRVQAVYAVPADRNDRYDQVLASIRQWAADTDAVVNASAGKTGGTRHVRFVTDAACNLVIAHVRLSAAGDDNFDNTMAELAAQGYKRPDRKYLVWMDSTVLCGIASYYVDDRPTPDNFNNGHAAVPGSVARIDAGCWGLASRGQSVEAHELMHNLGGVQPSAPHATSGGHCTDDADRMCYADGTLLVVTFLCAATQEAMFDCSDDDYFSTNPRVGSYLATHWNTASNSFLTSLAADPLISIGDLALPDGNSGTKTFNFPVTLTAPSTQQVTVRFATADGSARAPDDYAATSGTVSFAAGTTVRTVTVSVNGGTANEVDESFSVVLSSPANASIGKAQALGTIIDDGPTRPQGYWFVAADGGIFSFGDARFFGSTGNMRLNQPIVGMAATPTGGGYWFVARDGGVFAFGDARFFGSTGNMRLNQPIVGMAATPTGGGYWFVARDGGVFAFGDAHFFGSTGNIRLNQPIVGMAATPTGGGYWFVAADGGIFAFGDARFLGSPASVDQPVVAMAATPTGGGYWMAGRDGAVLAFGDARSFGGAGPLNQPVVGMAGTPKGGGHWLVARDGGIFSFGDARFLGSTGAIHLNQPIVGMTAVPGP
jgi:hypothetical protein